MIDFPITDLLSDDECAVGGSAERRLFRKQGYFPAYRCLDCHGYYTLLSDTVFEKTHQRPATLVLLLRGIAKGESSSRLSRELGIGRKRVMELRHTIQNNLYETLLTAVMDGHTFEADEVYQNAGEKGTPHLDPNDPPRRRANKARPFRK
jgi:transposase-like protein